MVFKQIAGLLARRIVFTKKVGDHVARGERVGLIKFGSRTDVIFAADAEMKVRVGDHVKGGSSVLAVAQPRAAVLPSLRAECGGGAMSEQPMQRADDSPEPRRRRKGLYILPSVFTAGNMAAGYYAISQAIQGTASDPWHFDHAAKAIGFAIVFDFFDGGIARLTNTTSAFGRELDSMADVIAFGVAPAVLAWMWGFRMLPLTGDPDLRNRVIQLGAIATFVFLLAGASRLARFNIQVNPQPSNPGRPGRKYFVGMPIPAGAGAVAAVVHLVQGDPLQYWWLSIGWGVFVFALAFLMVSTWRFFSLKGINFRQPQNFRWLIVIGAVIALIWFSSQYVLFLLALVYILSGVLARLSFVFRRPTLPPPPPQDEASHA